jgi:hypothetical protein
MLITASGCFGGGGSSNGGANPPTLPPPPPPPPPTTGQGGLWSGAVQWAPRDGFPGGALNVRALIAETGEFRMMLYEDFDLDYFASQGEQIFGTFASNGQDIATIGDAVWTARAVNEFSDAGAVFGMTGVLAARQSISGPFQANWYDWSRVETRIGNLSMNYHSIYESPSSLAILQGSYRTPDEVLTVDDQGVVFYQSAVSGCIGNGTAEVIDPDYNMYRMTIDVDACVGDESYRNGSTFTGLANIGENNDLGGGFLNATLEMVVSARRITNADLSLGYVPWSLRAHRN